MCRRCKVELALAGHVLASTEPLGDGQLQAMHNDAMIAHVFIEALVGEHARGRDFAVKVPMAEDVVADLRAQLRDAQQERDKFLGVIECANAAARRRDVKITELQSLADERGREVERLRAELCELYAKVSTLGVLTEKHRARIDAALTDIATPAATPPAHVYTSTACQHGLHDRCRKTCKFCGVACACSCHETGTTPPAQERPDMDTARSEPLPGGRFGDGDYL